MVHKYLPQSIYPCIHHPHFRPCQRGTVWERTSLLPRAALQVPEGESSRNVAPTLVLRSYCKRILLSASLISCCVRLPFWNSQNRTRYPGKILRLISYIHICKLFFNLLVFLCKFSTKSKSLPKLNGIVLLENNFFNYIKRRNSTKKIFMLCGLQIKTTNNDKIWT